MSQDDPFGADPDRTVIRPNPGGRRGPAAPVPPEAGPAAPPLQEIPALSALGGLNLLASAAAPLLSLAVRLRNTTAFRDVGALRERIVQEIHAFERRVSNSELPREALRGGHYAICATIDDVINNTPWGASSQWARHSMTGAFHNDAVGGDRFFDFLNHFQKEPGRYREVLELMYLCLSLGFEGRLRVAQRGASELSRLREGLYKLLQQVRGEFERTLAPHWRGLAAPHRPLSAVLPAWVAGAAVLAVLTLVFVAYTFLLGSASDAVFSRLAALPPAGPVALAVKAPAPPPVAEALSDRLRRFLAPEIREGLVTVLENAQTATVRIRGSDLFASGTATLNDKYLPLIRRVAQALDIEPGAVTVLGYTDNVPIRSLRFPSNYELSLARAQTVRDLLKQGLKTPRAIAVEGRADADPIAPNTTSEGRAANRRIEVVLQKQAGSGP